MHACSSSPVTKLIEQVRQLAPLVAEHRGAIERDRRLPAPLFDALAESGLFKLWLPKALGGPELSPIDFMAVVEEAAALDGSVGWLVGNGAGMSRVAGYLNERVSRTWFSEPQAFVVSATGAVGNAVPSSGGYRVTGRWPFGSGAHHASHFMGLCSTVDGDPGPLLCCHFPAKDVAVIDNWHVSGLRGTGSCDFEVRDVFVPAAHAHDFVDPAPSQPGALYRLPNASVFAWSVGVVPLGVAGMAIGCLADIARRKARGASLALLRDREIVQSEIGQAEAKRRAARAFLHQTMTDLIAAVDTGGDRLVRARASLRLACAHAADSAVQIVDAMARMAGTGAIFESGPLERCVRDVDAAVKHIAMSPSNYILSGRLRLGLDPGTTRF